MKIKITKAAESKATQSFQLFKKPKIQTNGDSISSCSPKSSPLFASSSPLLGFPHSSVHFQRCRFVFSLPILFQSNSPEIHPLQVRRCILKVRSVYYTSFLSFFLKINHKIEGFRQFHFLVLVLSLGCVFDLTLYVGLVRKRWTTENEFFEWFFGEFSISGSFLPVEFLLLILWYVIFSS